MDFEAPAADRTGVRSGNRNQTGLPAVGQDRRLRADTVSVIAIGPFEGGGFADGTVDEVGAVGMVPGIEIGLPRDKELFGGPRKLTENGLTADYDDIVIIGDRSRRADQVLQLRTCHK